jgi:hypothetical protein
MADEVERYEIENQVPIIKEQHPKNVIPLPSRLGGKPKSPLTEAVEHSYLKFYKEGNTQVLRAGKVREFLGRLKEFLEEGKPNFDDFVSERIKNIKITKAGCSITTQDKYQEASDSREIIIKSKIYMQGDVSKILSSLRKKYPL